MSRQCVVWANQFWLLGDGGLSHMARTNNHLNTEGSRSHVNRSLVKQADVMQYLAGTACGMQMACMLLILMARHAISKAYRLQGGAESDYRDIPLLNIAVI
jgi:hypothetical protein